MEANPQNPPIQGNTREGDGATRELNVSSRCSNIADPHDFSIIWHNLTYRVDSRAWTTKLKERLLRTSNPETIDIEDSMSGFGLELINQRRERKILNQICGDIKSRQLTGILGPSGAGKSSLLYCLFQNRTVGTSGRILVDSQNKKRLRVCFIPQKDYLNEWLTVREDLIFVSKLKLSRVSSILKDTSIASFQTNREPTENNSYVRQDGQQYNTSLIDHEANATRVSELLGLSSCLDVPIRNISGGQRKRLSIARELMSKPDILILDEPTTGLDSLTCYKTMMVLRDLAQLSPHPMAVIVTIHQPPRAVFNLFDKTYFLSNRGNIIYEDSPKNVIQTLETVGKVKLPSAHYNPASALIEIASDPSHSIVMERLSAYQKAKFNARCDANYIRKLMQCKQDVQNWKFCAINEKDSVHSTNSIKGLPLDRPNMAQHDLNATTPHKVDDISSNGDSTSTIFNDNEYFISHHLRDCLSSHSNNVLASFRHIFILTHRSWLSLIRNPTLTRSRLVFHATLPLIMLMIFGVSAGSSNNCPAISPELSLDDMKKSMDSGVVKKNVEETRLAAENISFFFILMYGFAINIISATASHYPLTIHMFKKETINGLYSAGPYFIGQTVAEIPLEVFFPSVSVILAYSLSGQIPSYLEWRMFAITFLVLLLCYTVHSLGLLFGSIFINDINVAVLLGQVALFPPILFSGFLIRTTRMPNWMLQLSSLSFFKHALVGIVAARYGYNVCDCDDDMLPEDGKSMGFSALPANVKHVLEYMFPTNSTDDVPVSEVFDKLGARFMKAQTFALNITTCEDVKPYSMTAFGVSDSDLYRGVFSLMITIVVLKFVTFSIIKLSPYRID